MRHDDDDSCVLGYPQAGWLGKGPGMAAKEGGLGFGEWNREPPSPLRGITNSCLRGGGGGGSHARQPYGRGRGVPKKGCHGMGGCDLSFADNF